MNAVRSPLVWLILVLGLALASHSAYAAQCSDIYGDTSGINANLQSSGDTLDLSGVPWANNPWPASGSTLAPGDYYYGSANLGNGYTLNVGGGGPVRIFVSGSLAFGNNTALNVNGAADEFLLVVDGSLSLSNNAVINGLVYATGAITLGNGAQVSGGLAAGGSISVGNNSAIDADYSGIDQGLLAGLCQMPLDLSANGDSEGPVTVNVGDSVSLSVTAEGCPAPAWWATHQQWADQWTIDGDVFTDLSNTTVCDRSPVSRSVTFDQEGVYLVRFEAFYRDCWYFVCTDQESYGADEITINPVGGQVDHFEIVLDGVALTCQPETVTLRACANASCDTLFTDPVEATLAPTSGWQGGNVVTISGGTGQATLRHTTAEEVTLDVIGSQPSTRPQAVTLCQIGSGSLSADNCTLEFVESGLAFDVPNLTSHRPTGPIEIRAVRQDDDTQACVPAFENVQKSVQFWSSYIDPGPSGRPVSRPVSVNGTDVSGDQSAPSTLDLDFGPGGIAEVEVIYPDAGQMQLDAWYVGSAATDDDGLVMPGADSFISVPAGLCVSAAGECAAGDATCPTFVRAGEDFDLSITAAGWEVDGDGDLCQGNPVTPNFRLLNIPLASAVVSPAGKENGALEPGDYSHTRSVNATEVVTAHLSEVGVFQFTATPDDGDYLGLTAPGGTSAPIGRFYPDTFNVTVDPGELEAECAAGTPFTYTGQDFGWLIAPSLLIEPLSVQGSGTLNYTETGFQRLTADDVARIFPVADSTTVNTGGDPMAVTTSEAGGSLSVIDPGQLQFEFSSVDDAFRYNKVPEARVAPFNPDLAFTISDVVDADGVAANAAPYDFNPAANFDTRYGRLAMDNAYGPETSGLVIPMRAEYFDGTRFVVNDAETCWTYNLPDDVVLDFSESALSDGDTEVVEVADSDLTLNGGVPVFNSTDDYRIRLAAPGVGKSESPDQRGINVEFMVEDWLRDFWDPDAPTTLLNPSALVTFGVYRGHDRVIYWQEK